ncbi:hypothetical protein GCM10011320_54370 [Neoroseomonas lacus]|uniref:Uncharacterized protein n=1 Tax=Neoroseomonas lacus TaxID=287609 RepID=A0A917L2M9_9PROT|nr:hypothetical protein GCM10011320_54370 [Neoroseomonas lacus]
MIRLDLAAALPDAPHGRWALGDQRDLEEAELQREQPLADQPVLPPALHPDLADVHANRGHRAADRGRWRRYPSNLDPSYQRPDNSAAGIRFVTPSDASCRRNYLPSAAKNGAGFTMRFSIFTSIPRLATSAR